MTIAYSQPLSRAAEDVPLWRLYLLRGLYLLIGVAQSMIQWPLIFQHGHWTMMSGVAHGMLAALATASFLGVRYPLKMLPLLFYETMWKTIWLAGVALPLWRAGQMDADTMETVNACLMGVIVPLALPWGYVFKHYVKAPADRWW